MDDAANGDGPAIAAALAGADSLRAARLMAVQALYQLDINGGAAEDAVAEFLAHRQDAGVLDDSAVVLFNDLVIRVTGERDGLDVLISGALKEDWRVGRLELVLKAILRCGVLELRDHKAVPTAVVLDEYVSLAHGFFGGKEPAMVNGLLDALARPLREGSVPEPQDRPEEGEALPAD